MKRKKFKEITSFKWMVKKEQYQLLKYKINRVGDEYIKFSEDGIKLFFQNYANLIEEISSTTLSNETTTTTKTTTTTTTTTTKTTTITNNDEINKLKKIETMDEILKLLFSKGREEFEKYNLTKLSVESNSIELLKLLIKNSYTITITLSMIRNVISNCSLSMINYLILFDSNCRNLFDQIKNSSLKLASQNVKNKEEIIGFLLDNPQLFNVHKDNIIPFASINELENTKIILKLYDLNLISKREEDIFNKQSPGKWLTIKCSFDDLLGLISFYFKIVDDSKTKSQILLNKKISEIIDKYSKSGIGNDGDKLKELRLSLAHEFNYHPILYREYIAEYEETIDGSHGDKVKQDNIHGNYKRLLLILRSWNIFIEALSRSISNSPSLIIPPSASYLLLSPYFNNYCYYFTRQTFFNREMSNLMNGLLGNQNQYPFHLLSNAIKINGGNLSLEITDQQLLDFLSNCEIPLSNKSSIVSSFDFLLCFLSFAI
ncbi:hypothetical protein ACTFIR_002923 [Dictyostelium discoideum]